MNLSNNGLGLSSCSVCGQTREQHLLIQCDTCANFYHLSCLDPPLTRMPKKTKQMGWSVYILEYYYLVSILWIPEYYNDILPQLGGSRECL